MAVNLPNCFSGWGAAFFIIGVFFSNTVADYAMVGSLMDFLRNVRQEKLPYAATTLNMQMGVSSLMEVAGAFLTDAYLGHYHMVLFSMAIYIVVNNGPQRSRVLPTPLYVSFVDALPSSLHLALQLPAWEPPTHVLEEENKGRLCTVTQVEETKLLLGMFPIWTTFLMYALVRTMGSTFFLEQAINMDRKVSHKITVPLTILLAFASTSKLVITQLCIPLIERSTKLEHGIPPMIKIRVGMFFSILCRSCAAIVEVKRLDVMKQCGSDEMAPVSIFWLLPQFFLLGAMDGLVSDGVNEFFYDHVPESMRSFGPSFSRSVSGMGSLLSALLIITSTKMCKWSGGPSWIADTIDKSHLNYFYRTLSVLSYINLCAYMYISRKYSIKKAKVEEEELEMTIRDNV